MSEIIQINTSNINSEHICCAISDKKCKDSYELKKKWLKKEFENGYVFRRINERAKVFIEYGPAETGWSPVDAPGYLLINCFWVAGKYKGSGYGKKLLQYAVDDAREQGKEGLVTVVGTKKYHFMSDGKWLKRQGFEECDSIQPTGFSLLALTFSEQAKGPVFNKCVLSGECPDKEGIVVYYSNRCPFSEYHVNVSLKETAKKRNIPLKAIKLETAVQAQSAPTPATIFSLFYKGRFITTDLSICMDSRYDKLMEKAKIPTR